MRPSENSHSEFSDGLKAFRAKGGQSIGSDAFFTAAVTEAAAVFGGGNLSAAFAGGKRQFRTKGGAVCGAKRPSENGMGFQTAFSVCSDV
ncbi:hypothetical protein HMPREF9120_00039 [Neisseria sp. oral taxon 020 str. F0370]|nr:hypothetical protein HMPREF9120_00039 [Neisseria sp. oral taxon 020 str. F0370]